MSRPVVETWLPVPGWEGRYEVSDLGRVRSFVARGGPAVLVMKPRLRKGYLAVRLQRSGMLRDYPVHRLVALAFCPRRWVDDTVVRHLDGDRLNNRAVNLAWGTQSDNEQDKLRHGTHPEASRASCDRGHEYTPENTGMDRGKRRCRTCQREWQREYQARTRGAQRAAARAAKAGAR